jgi:colanic acid/amylovoran biosynthesis glycosyltransferase
MGVGSELKSIRMTTTSASQLASAIRLRNWWKAKAANLLAVLYSVTLITALPFPRALVLLAAAVITILGIGGLGHVVNDLSDIPVDAAAGKPNLLAGFSSWRRAALILGLLALALLPWLVLPLDRLSVALLLIEFALLLAYAIPPVRLKQRGIWSLLTDAAYAYALPAILAAHTFFLASARSDSRALEASLFLWQMALGIRHFLNHLAMDRANDLRSGIPTLATIRGNHYIHSLIRHVILPIELVGLFGYLLVINQQARLLLFVIAGIFLAASSFHIVLAVVRNYPLLTYRFSRTQLDWLYQVAVPVVLLSYLVALDARFSVLLLAHVTLFFIADKAVPAQLQPVGAAIPSSKPAIAGSAQSFRFLPALEAVALPMAHSVPRVHIAVANINKDKYTETFVQGLVSRLHSKVYYLHGGELPTFDNDNRHFLTQNASLQAMAQLFEVVLRTEKDGFLKSSIRSYLQANDVRLLLAEFGPVGIQMLPIVRDLGIPLIVYFHGYDVFKAHTLELYAAQYPALFEEAACIIGVSEAMLNRLESLGAPREKLVHLPAFVNLELFPYSDHSSLPRHFLAVGRFAETKSPHLTLLAFHEVSKLVPEATLTLLGKGGGGELFEACLILARALGLENRVEFKGAVSHEEVAREMGRARIFVQHSVTTPEQGEMEGKPVAIMEAMASGLAVVATRHSGISELIEDGVSGLLVPEYDVAAMAAAMIRLAKDDALVRQLGYRASTFIRTHPLISRHVELMESIIARAIADS